MAYRNTFFRWLFLYSLTFGLTYVLKLFTYLCPETGQDGARHRRHMWVYWTVHLLTATKGETAGFYGTEGIHPVF